MFVNTTIFWEQKIFLLPLMIFSPNQINSIEKNTVLFNTILTEWILLKTFFLLNDKVDIHANVILKLVWIFSDTLLLLSNCFAEKFEGEGWYWSKLLTITSFYLNVVNHAISTKILHENRPLQRRKNKIPPWHSVSLLLIKKTKTGYTMFYCY